jgi:hypothetical protein
MARSIRESEWLLLQVCFADQGRARAAWLQLSPLDIDSVAHEVHGVFPQLAASLRAIESSAPVLPRLDGVRRRLWTRNTIRVRDVLDARRMMRSAGLRAEPTGGLATLMRQPDLGARPLVDAELQVDSADAGAARRVLVEDGWTVVGTRRDGWLLDLHAATLERRGQQLTLRWSDGPWPYPSGVGPTGSNPGEASDPSLPGPTPLLAYTLVEGHRLWGYTPVRRIADVLLLLTDGEGVQWGELVGLVGTRGGAAAARQALAQTHARFPDLVPDMTLAELGAITRRRGQWGMDLDERSGTLAALVRRAEARPTLRFLSGAPQFLRDVWGVEDDDRLVAAGARRLRARLARGPHGAGGAAG